MKLTLTRSIALASASVSKSTFCKRGEFFREKKVSISLERQIGHSFIKLAMMYYLRKRQN
jgi:hypothetical protein